MENSSLHRVGSLHENGASIFSSTNLETIFSSSSHDEDDEEALKWAAILKLPTFERMRKGILRGTSGEIKEVEIENLGFLQRRNLMERLIGVAEEENDKFLLKLKSRIDRAGIRLPTVEVRFEHLCIEGEAYVGRRGLPTMLNFTSNVLEGLLSTLHIFPTQKKPVSILQDVSGIIKPCRMALLLGPPGSGKSTLLLALAGMVDKKLKTSGRVTYNGHGMDEIIPQRISSYVSQHDLHIGEMTVRETLEFSARCQGVGSNLEMLMELLRREKELNILPDPDIDVYMKAATLKGQKESVITDYILKILGLEICASTLVGDQMRRGISGGQKKRLTTGEMLVGPAKALFMDEISTGLDSSTTFQIINSLRQSIHILRGTALIALLQPAPETYELFDDVILLSEGQIVYQGPREYVLEFFESMGFKCPQRKGVADFLQEVTSRKEQEQYWTKKNESYSFISVKEFAEAFQSFHVGRTLGDELGMPFDKSKSHPTTCGVSKIELLKTCFARELLLLKRNSFVYIFKIIQLMFNALITVTVFLRTKMHHDSIEDGGIFMGALFLVLVTFMFNGFAELPTTILRLPVFYKQRDLLFYPSWAYALPACILKIPISFAEVSIWIATTYYAIGFDSDFVRLFRQYLLLFLLNQMSSGLFRLMAALGRNMMVANTFGAFALLAVLTLGGFVVSREALKKWWIWGYWLSPLMYGQNAIATNEFLGRSWQHVVSNSTETLGIQVLKSRGIFTFSYWYWIGVAALLGYIFIFNGLFSLALAYLKPFGKDHVVPSEETLMERHANRTREVKVQGPSLGRSISTIDDELGRGNSLESAQVKTSDDATMRKKKGMILLFTPLSISFDDIKYSVDMPKEMKTQGVREDRLVLLNGISGAFRPGVLTALMGVTGAGKTTLMDLLAGRKTGGYIEGSIGISGYPKKQETFARICGYCEQNDIHSPHVTVYESLLYSAWLRLPVEVDLTTRQMFIEEVMELVELKSLREALVGLPGVNGLSTEQRKRLTIAVELVANPSIIFMDEPTSGLDARAASIVMRTVRNTVDTGRTVVCTIHQPSIDIFEAFDELLLIKQGGEEIYVGPLGHHSFHLIKYFEGINGVPKIREGYNPATWMLEVTSMAQEEILGINFADIYKNSDLYRRNKALIKELSSPAPDSKDLFFPTRYAQNFIIQCVACLWKQRMSYWRNPYYTAVRLLSTTCIALLLGAIFWNLGSKISRRQDLFNAMGSMYAAVLFLGLQNASSVGPVVAVERTVFYRERAAGMYLALPYAFAQVAIEFPYILIQTLVYGIIVYAMIAFEWTAAKFFCYIFFMYFTLLYFTFYGMMAIGLSPNLEIAAIVLSMFNGMWSLFTGFLIPLTRIPVWWRWYYWACPVSWTLYGLVASQFGDIEDTMLDTGETVAEFVRNYFGFKHDFLWAVAVAVVGFTLLFAFIFALSIKVFNFQRR